MLRRCILSLILLAPYASFGRDSCTNKNGEYTIDRRCYVTDEQKRVSPYNAVVRLDDCTSTIVKHNNRYYAAYCGTLCYG